MLTICYRFQRVFQGTKYSHTTYYRQRLAWVDSTEEERGVIARMARDDGSLWTVVRKTLSGWRAQEPHH